MSIVTSIGTSKNQLMVGAAPDPRSAVSRLPAKPLPRPSEGNGSAPLSFVQERLWFLDQINPGDVSSNVSRGVRTIGALDKDLLKEAIANVMARHNSLQTTFARI